MKKNIYKNWLLETDSNFNILNAYGTINNNQKNLLMSNNNNIKFDNKGNCYINKSPDSRLYKFNSDDTFESVIKLNFSKHEIPQELMLNKDDLSLYDWIMEIKNKGYCFGVSEYYENRYIKIFNFVQVQGHNYYYLFFNKQDKSFSCHNEKDIINDLDGGLFEGIVYLDNDKMICLVESYKLFDFINNNNILKSLSMKYSELLRKGNRSNPILIVFKR